MKKIYLNNSDKFKLFLSRMDKKYTLNEVEYKLNGLLSEGFGKQVIDLLTRSGKVLDDLPNLKLFSEFLNSPISNFSSLNKLVGDLDDAGINRLSDELIKNIKSVSPDAFPITKVTMYNYLKGLKSVDDAIKNEKHFFIELIKREPNVEIAKKYTRQLSEDIPELLNIAKGKDNDLLPDFRSSYGETGELFDDLFTKHLKSVSKDLPDATFEGLRQELKNLATKKVGGKKIVTLKDVVEEGGYLANTTILTKDNQTFFILKDSDLDAIGKDYFIKNGWQLMDPDKMLDSPFGLIKVDNGVVVKKNWFESTWDKSIGLSSYIITKGRPLLKKLGLMWVSEKGIQLAYIIADCLLEGTIGETKKGKFGEKDFRELNVGDCLLSKLGFLYFDEEGNKITLGYITDNVDIPENWTGIEGKWFNVNGFDLLLPQFIVEPIKFFSNTIDFVWPDIPDQLIEVKKDIKERLNQIKIEKIEGMKLSTLLNSKICDGTDAENEVEMIYESLEEKDKFAWDVLDTGAGLLGYDQYKEKLQEKYSDEILEKYNRTQMTKDKYEEYKKELTNENNELDIEFKMKDLSFKSKYIRSCQILKAKAIYDKIVNTFGELHRNSLACDGLYTYLDFYTKDGNLESTSVTNCSDNREIVQKYLNFLKQVDEYASGKYSTAEIMEKLPESNQNILDNLLDDKPKCDKENVKNDAPKEFKELINNYSDSLSLDSTNFVNLNLDQFKKTLADYEWMPNQKIENVGLDQTGDVCMEVQYRLSQGDGKKAIEKAIAGEVIKEVDYRVYDPGKEYRTNFSVRITPETIKIGKLAFCDSSHRRGEKTEQECLSELIKYLTNIGCMKKFSDGKPE